MHSSSPYISFLDGTEHQVIAVNQRSLWFMKNRTVLEVNEHPTSYCYMASAGETLMDAFQALPSRGSSNCGTSRPESHHTCGRGSSQDYMDDELHIPLHMQLLCGRDQCGSLLLQPKSSDIVSMEIVRVLPAKESLDCYYSIEVCLVFSCDCCAVVRFGIDPQSSGGGGDVRLFAVEWIRWPLWLCRRHCTPLETHGGPPPKRAPVLSVCCIGTRDGHAQTSAQHLLRIAYTCRADTVYYAECISAVVGVDGQRAGPSLWTVQAVGRLPLSLHADATFRSWGRSQCVRRVQWLPECRDFTGRHPLLAILHQYATLPGDMPLDHVTLAMLEEGKRVPISERGRTVELLDGAVLSDGPWAVRGVPLAHPSFLWSGSYCRPGGECNPIVGVFTRHHKSPYIPSRLLRSRVNNDKSNADAETARFVLYTAEGETCYTSIDGFVEDAVSRTHLGIKCTPTADHHGDAELLATLVVAVVARHGGGGTRPQTTLPAAAATSFAQPLSVVVLQILAESKKGKDVRGLVVRPSRCVVDIHSAHPRQSLLLSFAAIVSVWMPPNGAGHMLALSYHCEKSEDDNDNTSSCIASGAVLLSVSPSLSSSAVASEKRQREPMISHPPLWVSTLVETSTHALRPQQLLRSTMDACFSESLCFLSAPYTTGLGELLSCATLNDLDDLQDAEKGYCTVALLRSGCIVAWTTLDNITGVEYWTTISLPMGEGSTSSEAAIDQLACERLLSAETWSVRTSCVVSKNIRDVLHERCLLLCCVDNLIVLIGGTSGRVHHTCCVSSVTALMPQQVSVLTHFSCGESVFAMSALQLLPHHQQPNAVGDNPGRSEGGAALGAALFLIRVSVLACPEEILVGLDEDKAGLSLHPIATVEVQDAMGWELSCMTTQPHFSVVWGTTGCASPQDLYFLGHGGSVSRLEVCITISEEGISPSSTALPFSQGAKARFASKSLSAVLTPAACGGQPLLALVPVECSSMREFMGASLIAVALQRGDTNNAHAGGAGECLTVRLLVLAKPGGGTAEASAASSWHLYALSGKVEACKSSVATAPSSSVLLLLEACAVPKGDTSQGVWVLEIKVSNCKPTRVELRGDALRRSMEAVDKPPTHESSGAAVFIHDGLP